MKGLKLLTSLLAVGAVSTIFAAASFATDFTAGATYTAGTDGGADSVSITIPSDYVADNAVGDYTVVILNADVPNPANENIVYVMQGTKEEISSAKFNHLTTDGTYYVRIGGYSQGIAKATFTVGGGTTTPDIFIGDANGDGSITAADVTQIARKCASLSSTVNDNDTNYYAAAYSNGDAAITAADVTQVARKCASLSVGYVGKTVKLGEYGTK